MQPDQHGHDNFESFVRKEFNARAKSFAPESLELASFKHDTARIRAYLRDEVRPSANGLAIFACAGPDDYFKAVQLDAPIPRHRLHVNGRPHLYPLARVIDHPRPCSIDSPKSFGFFPRILNVVTFFVGGLLGPFELLK